MIVKALHPSIDGNIRTFLTTKANAAQAVLVCQDPSLYAQNDLLVIGNPTEELTEIKKITSITGKSITLSANLVNAHAENTKITLIKYDQVKFYKASSIAGVYSVVSTKSIAIDEPHTLYDDATAVTSDYFKIKYYNSQTTDLSVFSDPIASGGFPRFALINIQDDLFKRFGDKKLQFLDREEITGWLNELKDDMVNRIAENNEKHFAGYHEITLDGTGESDLPDEFKKEQKVMVAYDGVNGKRARRTEVEDIDESYSYSQERPVWYFNNYKIGVRPKGNATGKIFLWSEDHPADMENDSDEIPKPIRFYMHVIMDGLMAKAKEKDGKDSEANRYYGKYEAGCDTMLEHLNNLVLDENRGVKDEDDYE